MMKLERAFAVFVIVTAVLFAGETLAGAQTETVLHIFPSATNDGLAPMGGVVADSSGALYGATNFGRQG